MNITSDGTYPLTPENHRFSSGVVFVTGTLSTAIATISYSNNGILSPITDGILTDDSQYDIKHGKLAVLVLVVSGSGGSTNFNVNYHGAE